LGISCAQPLARRGVASPGADPELNPTLAGSKKNGHSFYMEKTATVNPIDPARRSRFGTAAALAIGVTPAAHDNWWN
jgi:hypothetical protein